MFKRVKLCYTYKTCIYKGNGYAYFICKNIKSNVVTHKLLLPYDTLI